MTEIDFKDT